MTLSATARINAEQVAPDSYRYSMTLTDTGTTDLGSFWFAWIATPIRNYLATTPSGFVNPAGWTSSATHFVPAGASDGYGIRWLTTAQHRIHPGDSLDYGFTTSDAPAALFANSVFYPTDPVLTSVVYSGNPFSDAGFQFVVAIGSVSTGGGNDSLPGDAGDNTLDGGAGQDTMAAGGGNDFYVLDDPYDAVIEATGGGTDTVMASIGYALGANVENLILTGTAVTGRGNDGDNFITGNGAVNKLRGGSGNDTLDGGVGADTATGGAGDDTFFIDDPGDHAIETAGEGSDTVISAIGSIHLGNNLENLVLSGGGNSIGWGNAGNNALTGNAGDNALRGGAGDDTLDGGAGHDTLTGGTGADVFAFLVGQADGDVVTDFLPTAGDTIRLTGFGTPGTGAAVAQLSPAEWQVTPSGGGPAELLHFSHAPAITPGDFHFN